MSDRVRIEHLGRGTRHQNLNCLLAAAPRLEWRLSYKIPWRTNDNG